MKNEDGFITQNFLILVFIFFVMIISILYLVNVSNKKVQCEENIYNEKNEARLVLNNFEKDIQCLSLNLEDNFVNDEYLSLLQKYEQYKISISDVSTKINTMFLKSEILENKYIQELLFSEKENIQTSYGWINPFCSSKELVMATLSDFSKDSRGKLFPLINDFPLYNIYCMSRDFIFAILDLNKIENAEEKATLLYQQAQNNILSLDEIKKTLGVKGSHSVMNFLGTKTTFLNVKFQIQKCYVDAVFAVVPSKTNVIEKYILIEKKIMYKT